MHSLHLSAIMFPGPRLKKYSKHNVRQNEKYTVNVARRSVTCEIMFQWSKSLVKTQVLDQNLQQIILVTICIFPPGFHTFYSLCRDIWSSIERAYTSLVTITTRLLRIFKHIKMSMEHHRERFNRLIHLNVFLLNVINQQYFIQSDH